MDKKVIEGVVYVPQEAMQAAMQERIKKLSADRVAAEDRAKDLQGQLDAMQGKLTTLDTLAQQVEDYKSQLSEANTRYTRHTSMADFGFTDPEIRDAVEWSFSKAMKGKPKKDQLSFADWLAEIKEDPTKAPAILQPHMQLPQVETEAAPEAVEAVPQAMAQQNNPALLPPSTNAGARPAPMQSADLVQKGLDDLDFYRANRDAIRKAYFNK
tara:strand:+ start:925 stop:1560 length:636 start_codon:yes stop_codon:yes gene_type:complete